MENGRAFYKLSLSTLIAVYILVLVGGIVRSTGSGMGCPDWPKCFGSYVPPTSVSELPENYKEVYSQYREKKNQKFARYLRAIGMSETADKLLSDRSVLIEADFNPTKTWIEYLNRLVGVVIGLLIFAVFVVSLRFWNSDRELTVIAFITFIMVGFQGWIGSFVVSSNLTPWTITIHMMLALLVVSLLIYLIIHSRQARSSDYRAGLLWWLIPCIILLLIQVVLGTQVRESIDLVAQKFPRSLWIDNIQSEFVLHRSFSWVLLLFHIGLLRNLLKTTGSKTFPVTLILLILASILTGIGMAYFAVPAFLQPLHLLLATVTFGMQVFLLFELNVRRHETKTV
jgi:cytochrome c oxidase assembly protein subunit 15